MRTVREAGPYKICVFCRDRRPRRSIFGGIVMPNSRAVFYRRGCGSEGGEQSGHIILPNEPTGDGILTSLIIAKAIAATQKSLNDLATIFTKSPQVTINLPVSPAQKQALKESESAKQILLAYQQKLSTKNGRLLVRPSGTEPLIRITAWGDDESTIAQIAEELKTKLGEVL